MLVVLGVEVGDLSSLVTVFMVYCLIVNSVD